MRASRDLLRLALVLTVVAAGCGDGDTPTPVSPAPSPDPEQPFDYGDALARLLGAGEGNWGWSWRLLGAAGDTLAGRAELRLSGSRGAWRLRLGGAAPTRPIAPALAPRDLPPGRLLLAPDDPKRWHEMRLELPPADGSAWLPLPRLAAASAYYADLLDLLQRLTAPRFGMRVTHWPDAPIPVVADSALSGDVDLAACLAEAVALWNGSPGGPYFALRAKADWGVRLVHLAGAPASPPLATRLIGLDAAGRPALMEIRAGDNYTTTTQRAAAVRGMSHELAHTLLLWGHSEDRRHLLWRCGPLVAEPSSDELRAIALWNLLPQGCGLAAYGRSVEIDPQRQQRQGPAVEERRRGDHAVAPQR